MLRRILLVAALTLLVGGSLVQAAEPGPRKLERVAHFGASPFRFGSDARGHIFSPDEKYLLIEAWRGEGLDLRRLTDGEVERNIPFPGDVYPLALSADNRVVAASVREKREDRVELREVASGKLLATVKNSEVGFEAQLSGDGRYAVVWGNKVTALIDLSQNIRHEFAKEELGSVHEARFSDDGKSVLLRAGEGGWRITLAKPAERAKLTLEEFDATAKNRLQLQLHGQLIRYWGVYEPTKPGWQERRWEREWLEGDDDPNLSPDGRVVAYFHIQSYTHARPFSYADAKVVLLDGRTGKHLGELPAPREVPDAELSVSFSPRSRYLLARTDHNFFVWDLSTRRMKPYCLGPETITNVCFTPDGKRVLAQDIEGYWAWDVASGKTVTHQRTGRLAGVSGDPAEVTVYTLQGRVERMRLGSAQPVWTWQVPDDFAFHGSKSLPYEEEQGERIVSAVTSATGDKLLLTNSGFVGSYDFRTQTSRLHDAEKLFDGYSVGPLWVDPVDPHCAAFAVTDHFSSRNVRGPARVVLVDCETGKVSRSIVMPDTRTDVPERNRPSFYGAPVATKKGTLVCALGMYLESDKKLVKVFAIDRAAPEKAKLLFSEEFSIRLYFSPAGESPALAISPDAFLVAFARPDGVVSILSLADGKPVAEATAGRSPLTCVAFSPNGKRLAAGTCDGQVVVWNWK